MAIWPWSVINRQKADITALDKALREESQLVGKLKGELKAERVRHQETRQALKIARDQREQFRVDLDNAIADLTAQQAKTRAAQDEAQRLNLEVQDVRSRLTQAQANDARDEATGKYVRQPDAAPKAPRVRKKAAPKP